MNFSSLEELYLSRNLLEGEIPKSLLDICSLRGLDLSYNNLSGRLDDFVPISTLCANKSLEELKLNSNQITGSVPDLSQFPSLQTLWLDNNRLNGTISDGIGNLSNLEALYISENSLQGVISEAHFLKLSKLSYLDLSSNYALDFNIINGWIPPFQLVSINLAYCKLGPSFSRWLRNQKNYDYLNLSSAKIFECIRNWFLVHSSSNGELDLSRNLISCEIPNLPLEYSSQVMHLNSNLFHGSIPSFLRMTSELDLSNNKFSNANSLLCANTIRHFFFLDLSNNELTGKLPDCWKEFQSLIFLDLSNNSFHGNIPSSMGSLTDIQALHLGNNGFTGEILLSLANCTELRVFDAAQNHLIGPVPRLFGNGLQNLSIHILRSNKFHGILPSTICHLAALHILDISFNNISGVIPKCLNNPTTLANQTNSNSALTYYFEYNIYSRVLSGRDLRLYDDSASLMWKGKMSKYKNTLGLVKSIDLSSNKLMGEIPNEITYLVGLISLNISRNRLTGEIPLTIGQLKSLDVLDLSRNHLGGRIPSTLSQLGLFGVLDLSYNNLSDEIPNATKLQSFDAFAYTGNPELCGIPLPKCLSNQTAGDHQNYVSDEDDEQLFTQGFCISMAIGFIIEFWGVCCSLFFIKSWRHAYFMFLRDIYSKLYVMVEINMTKLQIWIRSFK